MAEKKLTIRVNAENHTNAGLSEAESRLERFDKKAKSLEQTFGEDRTVNKLLQGGLVGYGGEKLAALAEKAVELKNKFHEGAMSATEIGVELAKGVPIIGSFVAAGQSIRELFTGEAEEIRRINEEAAKA